MASETWHYLENQFDNATKDSRKRMNMLVQDHYAKVSTGGGPGGVVSAALTAILGVRTAWQTVYQDWRNAKAAYQGATVVLENLLTALRQSPGGAQRSKIDEWESKVAAFWGPGHEMYAFLFPQGREPFTEGARDEIISHVGSLVQRLTVKATALTAAAQNPDLDPEQAAELSEQAAALAGVAAKAAAFHTGMVAARTSQQQVEGTVDGLSTQVETRRKEAAVALYGNLARLMLEFRANPGAAGAYFDLDTLMQTGADEEPVPPPASGGGTPP